MLKIILAATTVLASTPANPVNAVPVVSRTGALCHARLEGVTVDQLGRGAMVLYSDAVRLEIPARSSAGAGAGVARIAAAGKSFLINFEQSVEGGTYRLELSRGLTNVRNFIAGVTEFEITPLSQKDQHALDPTGMFLRKSPNMTVRYPSLVSALTALKSCQDVTERIRIKNYCSSVPYFVSKEHCGLRDWRVASISNNSLIWIDTAEVTKTGTNITFWLQQRYRAPVGGVSHLLGRFNASCGDHGYTAVLLASFTKQDEIVEITSDEQSKIAPSGTAFAEAIKRACGNTWLSGGGDPGQGSRSHFEALRIKEVDGQFGR